MNSSILNKRGLINFTRNPKVRFAFFVIVIWLGMMFVLRHVFPSSGDMALTQTRWWNYLLAHGFHGIKTIKHDIGADYTTIWYFLIVIVEKLHVYPHFSLEIVIKSLAVLGTLASSVAAFLITKHFSQKDSWKPIISAALILFIPPFFLDIIKTNLSDSIYISLSMFSVFAILKKRTTLAWFLLGIAMSFKMMAIYIAPFLIFFYIKDFAKNKLNGRIAPIFSLIGFLICSLPGIIAGQGIYEATVGTIFFRSASVGWGISQVLFSPNWSWMPTISSSQIHNFTIFGVLVILFIMILTFALVFNIKSNKIQKDVTVDLLVFSPLVFWLFMPAQHEGYFALAAVFSAIIFAIRFSKESLAIFISVNALLFLNVMNIKLLNFTGAWFVVILSVWMFWKIFNKSKIFNEIKSERARG